MINHSGFLTLGKGGTTGHQKRSPVARNDACSIPCHSSDCNPSLNAGGMCHPTNVAAAPTQQTAGCDRALISRCTGAERNSRLISACANCGGSPCNNGFAGAPSQSSGGASVI